MISEREDLKGDVGTNLHGSDWGNGRFLLTIRERHDPFWMRALYATFYVVGAEDEVRVLHGLEFVIMPCTSLGRRMDALIIGNNSCSARLLRARMISPTRLPKCIGYAGNCQRETSTLVSCTTVIRWKPSLVGEGT